MTKKISKELNDFLFQCPECGRHGKMRNSSFYDRWSAGHHKAWAIMECKHPLCRRKWNLSLGKT